MSAHPEARYQSPRQLADELERFLADEPVQAHPEPVLVRTRRWFRKHPRTIASTIASLLIGLLAASAIAVVVLNTNQALTNANTKLREAIAAENAARLEAEDARKLETRERTRAEAVSEFLVSAVRKPDPDVDGREVKVVDILNQLSRHAELELGNQPILLATLLHTLSRTYHGLGLTEEFSTHANRAYEIRRAEFGDSSAEALESYSNIGLAEQASGNYDSALEIFQHCFVTALDELGEVHPHTVTYQSQLGLYHAAAGNTRLAIELLEDALLKRRNAENVSRRELSHALDNLANAHVFGGEYSKAIPLFEQAIALEEFDATTASPEWLISAGNLAIAYSHSGDHRESVSLFEKCLDRRRSLLGYDHPVTLQNQHNLAESLRKSGDAASALPIMQNCLERQRNVLNHDHPDLLLTIGNLGLIYQSLGQQRNAIPLLTECVDLMKSTLGPSRPETLAMMNNLATSHVLAGDLSEAKTIFDELLEHTEDVHGHDHIATRTLLMNCGRLNVLLGEFETAEAFYDDAFKRHQAHPETDLNWLSTEYASVAFDFLSEEQFEFGEKMARKCLEARLELERTDWTVDSARFLIGACVAGQARLLRAAGDANAEERFAEAELLLLNCYEALRNQIDSIPTRSHIVLPETINHLIKLYTAFERFDEQVRWQNELQQLQQ